MSLHSIKYNFCPVCMYFNYCVLYRVDRYYACIYGFTVHTFCVEVDSFINKHSLTWKSLLKSNFLHHFHLWQNYILKKNDIFTICYRLRFFFFWNTIHDNTRCTNILVLYFTAQYFPQYFNIGIHNKIGFRMNNNKSSGILWLKS